jgi:hypothetical protein
MVISVEMSNLVIICVAFYPIEIIFNFISIAIISEFDNLVYSSMRNESMRKLIEDREILEKIFIKHHTTSSKCGLNELSDQVDEKGNFRPLRVMFNSRTCFNKFLFCVYKGYRAFFVSVYFYFFPFIAVIISILIPLYASS